MALRRADGVLDDEVDGRAMLIGSAGTHVIELNALGSLVWAALDGAREVPDLVIVVQEALDDPTAVPASQISADIEAFLAELERLALVEG